MKKISTLEDDRSESGLSKRERERERERESEREREKKR